MQSSIFRQRNLQRTLLFSYMGSKILTKRHISCEINRGCMTSRQYGFSRSTHQHNALVMCSSSKPPKPAPASCGLWPVPCPNKLFMPARLFRVSCLWVLKFHYHYYLLCLLLLYRPIFITISGRRYWKSVR